jgi:asparaginyl-tRNA synthetase
MQSYTDISDLYSTPQDFIQKVVTVNGWIKLFRISGNKNKKIAFIRLSDGSTIQTLQIIIDTSTKPTYFDELIQKGKTGMSLQVIGLIVESPAKGQPIEMQAHEFKIYGDVMSAASCPISKNDPTLEYLRDIPHLRVRNDTFLCINKIKSTLKLAAEDYFKSIKFVEVQVPLITDNECESGANPFTVTTIPGSKDFTKDFFKKPTYLTVSGQLHLEAVVLGGVSKAYCMTTAFRAEPSMSPLHMAEFWMLELEFCFGDLDKNMAVNEGCIKYAFSQILTSCIKELEYLQQKNKSDIISRLTRYVENPFIITTHQECIELMLQDIEDKKVTIDVNKKDGDIYVFKDVPTLDGDLTKDHEKYITQILFKDMPVFVRYYPAKIKAFYMPKINKGADIERVDNFDLLFPGIGEVVGGSMRESDYDELGNRMDEMGIPKESLQFYLDLRKYGTVPHGGSGIGFDRLMLVATGMNNIRDMIPFPRAYKLCHF